MTTLETNLFADHVNNATIPQSCLEKYANSARQLFGITNLID